MSVASFSAREQKTLCQGRTGAHSNLLMKKLNFRDQLWLPKVLMAERRAKKQFNFAFLPTPQLPYVSQYKGWRKHHRAILVQVQIEKRCLWGSLQSRALLRFSTIMKESKHASSSDREAFSIILTAPASSPGLCAGSG